MTCTQHGALRNGSLTRNKYVICMCLCFVSVSTLAKVSREKGYEVFHVDIDSQKLFT